jgi:molybdate transport system ATP-binding protein
MVRGLFDQFGLGALADRPFARLSTGEQRLVLFIRALVKQPQLLILDEPFQGMDAAHVARCRDWLDGELRAEQTLLFVTHLPDELPRCIDRIVRLDHGRAKF